MAEDIEGISRMESFQPKVEQEKGLPPPLPEAIQPSRREQEQFIPNPELYKVPITKRDGTVVIIDSAALPHHGVLHGEETAILTKVLINAAYQDVLKRRGKEFADTFRSRIDEKALSYAAAYHDCGRRSDWRLFQGKEEIDGEVYKGEMQIHGPRGAHEIKRRWEDVDPELTEEQVERMTELIRHHTPTPQETRTRIKDKLHLSKSESRASRKVEKEKNFEDYEPEELMLRFLQEADRLGMPRGYHSRKLEKPRRTPFAMGTSAVRAIKSHVPFLRNRMGHVEKDLRFSVTSELNLYAFADALTRLSRHDPEIDKKVAHNPYRAGAGLAAMEKLKSLKP